MIKRDLTYGKLPETKTRKINMQIYVLAFAGFALVIVAIIVEVWLLGIA